MDVDSNRILGYITFRIHELTADVIDRHDMPVSRKARKRWKDRYPALLIMKLATTPQSRKQGVGGALLREAFDAAIKTRELIGLWGITFHPFENRQAIINFYGNFGFQYRCSEVGALMWLSVADLIEVMGASAPPVSK